MAAWRRGKALERDRLGVVDERRESRIGRVWDREAMKAAEQCWMAERRPEPPSFTGRNDCWRAASGRDRPRMREKEASCKESKCW